MRLPNQSPPIIRGTGPKGPAAPNPGGARPPTARPLGGSGPTSGPRPGGGGGCQGGG